MKPNQKLFPIPNFFDTESDTFSDTKFLRYRNRYFFRYQNFSIPNPKPPKKLKSFETEKFRNRNVTQNTPNLNKTESETTQKMEKFRNREVLKPKPHPKYPKSGRNRIRNFFDIKFSRYRIRYFFRYQIFPILKPIFFFILNFFDTESETIQKKRKVLKPRSFKTETLHSGW